MARGAFIVLEGLDRSGKSTQVAKLVDRLNQTGHKARLQKFPDRTTAIGKMIDAYLQSQAELDDRAIHLLFSANRWECAEAIKRDLANGMTIVADRYAFSGIAFSAAKGLPFTFCLNPDAGLPLPDLTLYLTVPPEVASTRGAYGVERYENLDMQTRTREQFAAVAREVQARHGEDRWVQVSAVGTIDEVEARIWELVDGALRRVDETRVGELWL
ncbi:Thymidylate kinase [Saitozyma podzolica]|uniref:Thymidylate kinase n=1 Tax=Saitozyma podzolica TaxID=1890683 RepID=A0A427Y7X3_9TREE|nr:Thymidylate kinase [Saitozyma podzolica]